LGCLVAKTIQKLAHRKEGSSSCQSRVADERKALEAKAAKLAADRDAWRENNVAEKSDSFDINVMKSVRKQATRYGVAS
jgi:hypothetical protein